MLRIPNLTFMVKKKEKQFEPFTIEITVENIKELRSLWHRFNACGYFNGSSQYKYESDKHQDADFAAWSAWDSINAELNKYETK